MEDSVKYHITWDRRREFDTGRSSQKPGDRLPASIRKRAFGPRGFASALTDFVFAEDPVSEADIIFVPGNGYPQMAEEAAALYRRGYAPRILPSGRFYIYDDAFDGVKARQEIYTGPYETEWAFAACLSSRFPYGEEINEKKLHMVDKAEQLLLDLGFHQLRVRLHDSIARIELMPSEFGKFMEEQIRLQVYREFKKIGFSYVTLDVLGYRTGSMNETLTEKEKAAVKSEV